MTNSRPARRPTPLLALALLLGVLAAALLGPSQTLAQTHKSACAARSRPAHTAHACTQSAHKGKGHHTRKRHKHTKKHRKATPSPGSQPPTQALCQDGSAPVRAANGSFSCDDGSEPQCQGGTIPTRSSNGQSLLCPMLLEDEPSTSEPEAECEEQEEVGCSVEPSPSSSESACAASPGAGSSFACEGER